jgi:hypothetical protein
VSQGRKPFIAQFVATRLSKSFIVDAAEYSFYRVCSCVSLTPCAQPLRVIRVMHTRER